MATQSFEDLDIWKRGCQLAVDIHINLHESKDFALRQQLERSSLSIPSNIAEGAERNSTADFIRFLRYSKGSCGELRTQLYIAERVRQGLGTPEQPPLRDWIRETRELSRMLHSMIESLSRRLTPPHNESRSS